MTTRPLGGARAHLRSTRVKRLSNFIRVERTDGQVFRWSDHDRPVTLILASGESGLYAPAIFAGASQDRREAALKTPTQNVIGLIDDDVINIPDLLGQRYRGARVEIYRADWKLPWRQFSRDVRWIRNVKWDEFRFVATLDGLGSKLERTTGGRFGGIMTLECPYTLGGTYCKKDISAWQVTGARVGTVNSPRSSFDMTTASFPTAETDEFYRYGEMEWLWGIPEFEATLDSTTSTTLTDTAVSMTPNAHVGQTVRLLSGTAGPVTAYVRITANTATTITYDTSAFMSGATPGTFYDVVPDASNLGFVSEIGRYTAASRKLELFVPTPFPVVIGDSGIVRVGCDGLDSTCDGKFSNLDNFGGVHIQPEPGDQWETGQ